MKRVETREATTSRGAEGAGPAGAAAPPEPGVTWSVVSGVSEGGRGEGRATSLCAGKGGDVLKWWWVGGWVERGAARRKL